MLAVTNLGQKVFINKAHVESVRACGPDECVVALVSDMEYKFSFPMDTALTLLGFSVPLVYGQ